MRKAANKHVDNLVMFRMYVVFQTLTALCRTEGQAFYLLMETAAKDLVKK